MRIFISMRHFYAALLILFLMAFSIPDSGAQEKEESSASRNKPENYVLKGQTTCIYQSLFPFHSPYEGPKSFRSRAGGEYWQSSTIFAGLRLSPSVDLFVDPELVLGIGPSANFGLGGYVNGDSVLLPPGAPSGYLARCFLRITMPTGKRADMQKVKADFYRIEGTQPAHRLEITAGRLSCADLFDLNFYSDNAREQFMNLSFVNNLAWDYPQDALGYTLGGAVEWLHPDWALRFGRFAMPKEPGGLELSYDLNEEYSDLLELELHPGLWHGGAPPPVFRLMVYRNVAPMGNYRIAIDIATLTGTVPSLSELRTGGATKTGLGVNFEQPLGDDAHTGIFGRLGWNDGRNETWAYEECDATYSIGGQLSGSRWKRPGDWLGVAFVQNEISPDHRDFLAAGGDGVLLDDGRLNYGPEMIAEAYYCCRLETNLSVSLDYQFVQNPGYNHDRGPASVLSLRLYRIF